MWLLILNDQFFVTYWLAHWKGCKLFGLSKQQASQAIAMARAQARLPRLLTIDIQSVQGRLRILQRFPWTMMIELLHTYHRGVHLHGGPTLRDIERWGLHDPAWAARQAGRLQMATRFEAMRQNRWVPSSVQAPSVVAERRFQRDNDAAWARLLRQAFPQEAPQDSRQVGQAQQQPPSPSHAPYLDRSLRRVPVMLPSRTLEGHRLHTRRVNISGRPVLAMHRNKMPEQPLPRLRNLFRTQ